MTGLGKFLFCLQENCGSTVLEKQAEEIVQLPINNLPLHCQTLVLHYGSVVWILISVWIPAPEALATPCCCLPKRQDFTPEWLSFILCSSSFPISHPCFPPFLCQNFRVKYVFDIVTAFSNVLQFIDPQLSCLLGEDTGFALLGKALNSTPVMKNTDSGLELFFLRDHDRVKWWSASDLKKHTYCRIKLQKMQINICKASRLLTVCLMQSYMTPIFCVLCLLWLS